jgi:hypothetical protein
MEIGNCLANNSLNIDFWKIAAYNEFENNFNSLVARNIFQKCIRINRKNLQAYIEYFIFELKFVEKLMKRKKVLKEGIEEEKKLKFIDGETNNKEEEAIAVDNTISNINDNVEITDDILNLRICEIIWRKAKNELGKDNIEIDLEFLKTLLKNGKEVNYKGLKEVIIKEILSKGSIEAEIEIVKAKLEKYETKVKKNF